jgi:hypothetical protein
MITAPHPPPLPNGERDEVRGIIPSGGSDEISHIIEERRDKVLSLPKLVSELASDGDHGL